MSFLFLLTVGFIYAFHTNEKIFCSMPCDPYEETRCQYFIFSLPLLKLPASIGDCVLLCCFKLKSAFPSFVFRVLHPLSEIISARHLTHMFNFQLRREQFQRRENAWMLPDNPHSLIQGGSKPQPLNCQLVPD